MLLKKTVLEWDVKTDKNHHENKRLFEEILNNHKCTKKVWD